MFQTKQTNTQVPEKQIGATATISLYQVNALFFQIPGKKYLQVQQIN